MFVRFPCFARRYRPEVVSRRHAVSLLFRNQPPPGGEQRENNAKRKSRELSERTRSPGHICRSWRKRVFVTSVTRRVIFHPISRDKFERIIYNIHSVCEQITSVNRNTKGFQMYCCPVYSRNHTSLFNSLYRFYVRITFN